MFTTLTVVRARLLVAVLFLLALTGSGCATSYGVLMDSQRKPEVEFVRATTDAEHMAHKTVMVIPPASMSPGRAEELTARVETALLERGLTLISSARGVDLRIPDELSEDPDPDLSDRIEVIELIESSEAEVVVKIVKLEWSPPMGSRFFILSNDDDEFLTEVDAEQYGVARDPKYAFDAEILTVEGKIISVENGEILDTFTIRSGANWHLANVYSATLEERRGKLQVVEESFNYSKQSWAPEAKQAVFESAMDILAASLLGLRTVNP